MQLPLCPKLGFTFAPADRELLKPCLHLRATARAIPEETIFVNTSSGRLTHLHTEMIVTSNCMLSVLIISFTYFNTGIYQKKASFADVFTDQKGLYKKIFLMKVEEDLNSFQHKLRSNIPNSGAKQRRPPGFSPNELVLTICPCKIDSIQDSMLLKIHTKPRKVASVCLLPPPPPL